MPPFTITGDGVHFRNIQSEASGSVVWNRGGTYTYEHYHETQLNQHFPIHEDPFGGRLLETNAYAEAEVAFSRPTQFTFATVVSTSEAADFSPLIVDPVMPNVGAGYTDYNATTAGVELTGGGPVTETIADGRLDIEDGEDWIGTRNDGTWTRRTVVVNDGATLGAFALVGFDTNWSYSITYIVEPPNIFLDEYTDNGSSISVRTILPITISVTVGSPPEKAVLVSPTPSGVTGVLGDAGLEWVDGGLGESNAALGFDLYFAESEAGLSQIGDPHDAESVTSTAENANGGNYYPGRTFYWRVDAFNTAGTTTGDVWTFTAFSSAITPPPRPDGYDETGLNTLGGGRYGKQFIAIGHRKIYFSELEGVS